MYMSFPTFILEFVEGATSVFHLSYNYPHTSRGYHINLTDSTKKMI